VKALEKYKSFKKKGFKIKESNNLERFIFYKTEF